MKDLFDRASDHGVYDLVAHPKGALQSFTAWRFWRSRWKQGEAKVARLQKELDELFERQKTEAEEALRKEKELDVKVEEAKREYEEACNRCRELGLSV